MSATVYDLEDWTGSRTREGHRNITAKWKVRTTSPLDGPAAVMAAAGLPVPGSTWAYGGDSDPWMFCTPDLRVEQVVAGERCREWTVEQEFTTEPLQRCQTTSIENPLNEPPEISGSFLKYTQEALVDRNGDAMTTSAGELFRGKEVERDFNRPTINIGLNVLSLPLSTFSDFVDTVNDSTLWGLSARKIKLGNISWSRKLYGTCTYYYTMNYEFEVNFKTWDRTLVDRGTKILMAGGTAGDQDHYIQKKDPLGENVVVFLNGSGALLPAGSPPVTRVFEIYDERNMLTLGIPSSL
jgi:hypothetical protein